MCVSLDLLTEFRPDADAYPQKRLLSTPPSNGSPRSRACREDSGLTKWLSLQNVDHVAASKSHSLLSFWTV